MLLIVQRDMQNNLLPYLEELANSCKPRKSNYEPTFSDPYVWINKYCSFKFDDEKNLVCINSLGKTLKIENRSIKHFEYPRKVLLNNENIMRLFSNSQFDLKYTNNNYIIFQIHDCSLFIHFTDNKPINNIHRVIKSTGTGYEIEFTINNGTYINLDMSDFSRFSLNEPEKYLGEIILNYNNDIIKEITNFSLENVEVKFNKFKVTMAIKSEFNKFIISELGNNATHNNIMKLLSNCIEKNVVDALNEKIHSNTLMLIELVKQKEVITSSRNKFILLSKVKPNYDKCMTEIVNIRKNKNKSTDFDKKLANIQNVPSLLQKFIKIWSFDNIDEFQKQYNLEDSELELAKYLYKLDITFRTQKLLENNIFV